MYIAIVLLGYRYYLKNKFVNFGYSNNNFSTLFDIEHDKFLIIN